MSMLGDVRALQGRLPHGTHGHPPQEGAQHRGGPLPGTQGIIMMQFNSILLQCQSITELS